MRANGSPVSKPGIGRWTQACESFCDPRFGEFLNYRVDSMETPLPQATVNQDMRRKRFCRLGAKDGTTTCRRYCTAYIVSTGRPGTLAIAYVYSDEQVATQDPIVRFAFVLVGLVGIAVGGRRLPASGRRDLPTAFTFTFTFTTFCDSIKHKISMPPRSCFQRYILSCTTSNYYERDS